MTIRLIKTYTTAVRADTVDIASKHADYALDKVKQRLVPITNVIGAEASGKSIFWDIAVQKLLGNNAALIPQSSENQQQSRLYETWTGYNAALQRDLRIFVCNIRASEQSAQNLDIESLKEGNFNAFGNVIIFTNAYKGFIPNSIEHLEYNVSSPQAISDRSNRWAKSIAISQITPS